ncbi:MAG: enoyl-ACP reductase [Gemmatimonadetes bacterium]|nr:MAG: enoyl-ACP reductase [Gemmatimonadota bacterium]
MGMLSGKKIVIAGIASERSIATGIADAMFREGAELAFTYLNDRLKDRVATVAKRCHSELLFPCDVTDDAQIKAAFEALTSTWETFDGIVHAIAFAPKTALNGDFLESVDREAFRISHEVSSYSFAAMAKEARPYLNPGASLITLSYLGAERYIPNYNVMGLAKASLEANVRFMAASLGKQGVRVNAISAGPVRTLSAAGITNFKKMLSQFETSALLKRLVTIEEIGNSAAFLASDLASAITGQIIHVDNGFNVVAATNIPD